MKKLLISSIVAIFAASFGASTTYATRVLEILERSYELDLADVSLPQSTNGTVGYKPCDSCVREYMPVSGATTYYVGQQMMTQTQFNAEAARIRQVTPAGTPKLLMLHYDPETQVATRIRIHN